MLWLSDQGEPIRQELYMTIRTQETVKANLQTGHVPLDLSQGRMQPSWNGCLQGSVTTINSSGSSGSNLNDSLQTAQSLSNSGATWYINEGVDGKDMRNEHPSVSTSLGRLSTISSVAATGLPAVEFSASWVNIWSNALGLLDAQRDRMTEHEPS